MGKVDFDFKPSVPVFDANVSLGRRHDRRVSVDTAEGTLAAMNKAGVERALSARPDLILMDMSLPVIDGWTATSQLKADDETRQIPIIALTAHAMTGDREKAIEAGCDEFDTKPVELKRLLSKIEQLLN